MLKCQYCDNLYPKLAKAHIIPRSFYKISRGQDNKSIELIIDENDKKTKFWQSGIYDSEIVCQNCEKLFNDFDTHGYKVLSRTLSQKMISNGSDEYPAYLIEDVDYSKLKLFFLSMLWRAHASKFIFYSHVELGSHEPIIRSYISKKIAPPHDKYEMVLFHLLDQPYPSSIVPPWRSKIRGVNVYRFYLPGLFAMIKVDQRPIPTFYEPMILRELPPHRLFFLPYSGSSEMRYIEKIKDLMKLRIKNSNI
jgi:hypothetical protein